MNPALRKFIYPFLLPNGLLCLLAVYGLAFQELPVELQPFLNVFPVTMVVVALLLGWRFNRTRLLCALLLLLLVDIGLNYAVPAAQRAALLPLVAIMLPVNLLLVSWFKERGLVNLRTALWGLVLLAQLLGGAWVLKHHEAELQQALLKPLVDIAIQLPVSQVVLLVNFVVLLLFALRCLVRVTVFEASFFWAQIILLAGFSGLGAQPLRLYLTVALLLLVMGTMESSHALAYRDELTGLPGRRALNETMAKLGNKYTLAMLDIDHFKKFNDTHGHDVGDQVLRMVASRLATVSGGGKVFRYGGEEFTVVFPRKPVKEALPFLEVLRVAVEDARFIPRGKDRPKKKPKQPPKRKTQAAALKVTISIGAAERTGQHATSAAVIEAADKALYRAKKAGRNRVCS